MSITCAKLCKECPFSNTSLKGWLANYTPDSFISMMSMELPFVCHMLQEKDFTWGEIDEQLNNGEIKICRGYVESVIKYCQSPRKNKHLIKAVAEVKNQGLSENSMSKWDFKEYHK